MNRRKVLSVALVFVFAVSLGFGCSDKTDGSRAISRTTKGSGTMQGYDTTTTSNEISQWAGNGNNTSSGSNPITGNQSRHTGDNEPQHSIGEKVSSEAKKTAGTGSTTKKLEEPSEMYYVYVNDMLLQNISSREKYDQFSFVTSLQGSINRNKPSIFIEWDSEVDRFWHGYITSNGKFLHGTKIHKIGTFEKFVETFLDEIKKRGLVVWDKRVPATSNVAATICGVEGYLPVRYETDTKSVYHLLTTKYKIPVKLNLVDKFTGKGTIPDTNKKSSGSKKCDAYIRQKHS